jgi:twitching motility protein PilU
MLRLAEGATVVEIMVNTRYVADLTDKGDIGKVKEAMEKNLSLGSQTFEKALLELAQADLVTQEEALANAYSTTNRMWLINSEPNSLT